MMKKTILLVLLLQITGSIVAQNLVIAKQGYFSALAGI